VVERERDRELDERDARLVGELGELMVIGARDVDRQVLAHPGRDVRGQPHIEIGTFS